MMLTMQFFFYVKQFESIPIGALTIANEARKDKTLSRVLACVKTGQWVKDEVLNPYFQKRNKLSVYQGC